MTTSWRAFASLWFIPFAAVLAAAGDPALSPDLFRELRWRSIGPFRGGRTIAAAGVPSQPNVFYMAQVNGGVWKTDDAGRTWNPIFDAQPTQSVGSLAVAPSDPNIIYAGSGEGTQRPDLSVGNGVYRSADAGRTWTHLGLRDGRQIPALAVDPRDASRVFAAVLGHPYGPNDERGLYRSADGGATWQKVLGGDAHTGATGVVLDPGNPDIVYASLHEARHAPWEFDNQYYGTHGGLFKSTDGGNTWRPLTEGLPAGLIQVNVAIAPSAPRRLYASVAAKAGLGVYRSDNAGETWALATTDSRPTGRVGGGGELPALRVDPLNPDLVYSPSIVLWKSVDGAHTWSALKGAPGGDDYQSLWINPANPDVILLVADQGAVVTVNGGRTWSSWYNQPTAQMYHVTADNSFPYRIYGGQQESGSVGIASRGTNGLIGPREWSPVGVIEYGYAAPDPLDPNIVYGAGRGEVSRFHWDTGQVEMITPSPLRDPSYRANRTQPILFSPVDPRVLYYAANILYRTTDGGASWQTISPDLSRPSPGIPANLGGLADSDPAAATKRGVIYSLAPSPLDGKLIWAGTDDGLLWVTHDGGAHWNDITPPALTPWSKVTQLEASHFDAATAYASVSRFRLDDLTPCIYRTRDGGKSWQLITAGLPPDAPVDTVREDPVRRGLLFAGTENAVWVSFDDGDHWQSLQLNLPRTSMRDLIVHDRDLVVGTHGRGIWILDDITPLRQMSAALVAAPAALLNPAPAWRVRDIALSDTPIPPDEPYADNPPDGAVLDYYLRDASNGPITLEILDAKGGVVRRFSSADAPEVTAEDLPKLTIPAYWPAIPPVLSAAAGLHRWVWDLHHTAPDSLRHEYPINALAHRTPRTPRGPRALPGSYTVRLTAAGRSFTAPLNVRMDPRVRTAPDDLKKLHALQTQFASLLTRTTAAQRQARALNEQMEKLKPAAGPLADALAAFAKKIKTEMTAPAAGVTVPTIAGVNGKAATVYGDIDKADTAPTQAQQAALARLKADHQAAQQNWQKLLDTDVPPLNRQLRAAGLAELQVAARARNQADDAEADDLD